MKLTAVPRIARMGFERLPAQELPRHQHAEAYATIVLGGAYEQFSYAGRLRLQAGDVLIQPTFDCHFDQMLSDRVDLIRLPWHLDQSSGGIYRNCAIELIECAARRDVRQASALLEEALVAHRCIPACVHDWPDVLAADLAANPRLRIRAWSEAMRLTREHVCRGFRATYGTGPTQFRSELSARAAWSRIISTTESMSRIAANLGFADQAHMSRAVKTLTGRAPSQWRNQFFDA
ncbi:MAG TPA: helix-turn-helix transcriptional regulator [Steroidobacteraceae bacterium]|jgi:AraC-like DNA-binding protein|nr:helix-turn-helix transcriptional regulator [Steroidobacteraceae bacterium]